jgi:ABC-type polar amino acid transport system ATPase subunit
VRELAHASDMSMLIVTHEMAFAAGIADRIGSQCSAVRNSIFSRRGITSWMK